MEDSEKESKLTFGSYPSQDSKLNFSDTNFISKINFPAHFKNLDENEDINKKLQEIEKKNIKPDRSSNYFNQHFLENQEILIKINLNEKTPRQILQNNFCQKTEKKINSKVFSKLDPLKNNTKKSSIIKSNKKTTLEDAKELFSPNKSKKRIIKKKNLENYQEFEEFDYYLNQYPKNIEYSQEKKTLLDSNKKIDIDRNISSYFTSQKKRGLKEKEEFENDSLNFSKKFEEIDFLDSNNSCKKKSEDLGKNSKLISSSDENSLNSWNDKLCDFFENYDKYFIKKSKKNPDLAENSNKSKKSILKDENLKENIKNNSKKKIDFIENDGIKKFKKEKDVEIRAENIKSTPNSNANILQKKINKNNFCKEKLDLKKKPKLKFLDEAEFIKAVINGHVNPKEINFDLKKFDEIIKNTHVEFDFPTDLKF